jgi:hypothetical protein
MTNRKEKDKTLLPLDGNCWFCFKKIGTMEFSCELDTMVHLKCIKRALAINKKHSEAKIMAREFEVQT